MIAAPGMAPYWFVNDELKDIGAANDDPNLAASKPASSLHAVTLGSFPTLIHYRYVTKHQNMALRGAAAREQLRSAEAPPAIAA